MSSTDDAPAAPMVCVSVRPSMVSRAAVLAAVTAMDHGMTEAEAELLALVIRPHDLVLTLTVDRSSTRTVTDHPRPLRFSVRVPALTPSVSPETPSETAHPTMTGGSVDNATIWGGWIRHRDLVESLRSRVKNSEEYGVLSDDQPVILEVWSSKSRPKLDRLVVHPYGGDVAEPRQIPVMRRTTPDELASLAPRHGGRNLPGVTSADLTEIGGIADETVGVLLDAEGQRGWGTLMGVGRAGIAAVRFDVGHAALNTNQLGFDFQTDAPGHGPIRDPRIDDTGGPRLKGRAVLSRRLALTAGVVQGSLEDLARSRQRAATAGMARQVYSAGIAAALEVEYTHTVDNGGDERRGAGTVAVALHTALGTARARDVMTHFGTVPEDRLAHAVEVARRVREAIHEVVQSPVVDPEDSIIPGSTPPGNVQGPTTGSVDATTVLRHPSIEQAIHDVTTALHPATSQEDVSHDSTSGPAAHRLPAAVRPLLLELADGDPHIAALAAAYLTVGGETAHMERALAPVLGRLRLDQAIRGPNAVRGEGKNVPLYAHTAWTAVRMIGPQSGDLTDAVLAEVPATSAEAWWTALDRYLSHGSFAIPEELSRALMRGSSARGGPGAHPCRQLLEIPDEIRQRWLREREYPVQGRFWTDDALRVYMGVSDPDFGTIEVSDTAVDPNPAHFPMAPTAIAPAFGRPQTVLWGGQLYKSDLANVVHRVAALSNPFTSPMGAAASADGMTGAAASRDLRPPSSSDTILVARWAAPSPSDREGLPTGAIRLPDTTTNDRDGLHRVLSPRTVWREEGGALQPYEVRRDSREPLVDSMVTGDLRIFGLSTQGEHLHFAVPLTGRPVTHGQSAVAFALDARHLHDVTAFIGSREAQLAVWGTHVQVSDGTGDRIIILPTVSSTEVPPALQELVRAAGVPAQPGRELSIGAVIDRIRTLNGQPLPRDGPRSHPTAPASGTVGTAAAKPKAATPDSQRPVVSGARTRRYRSPG